MNKLTTLKFLMDQIPGKNVERIRKVAEITGVSEQTVRTWLCSTQKRPIPNGRQNILARELKRVATEAK